MSARFVAARKPCFQHICHKQAELTKTLGWRDAARQQLGPRVCTVHAFLRDDQEKVDGG